jgi:hypothetical protein
MLVGGVLGPKHPPDRLHRDARGGPARERTSTDGHRRDWRFRPVGRLVVENLLARGVPAAQIAAALRAEQDNEAAAITFVVAASGIAIGQWWRCATPRTGRTGLHCALILERGARLHGVQVTAMTRGRPGGTGGG